MIVAATLLNLIKIKPSQQLTVAVPMGVRAEQEGWGAVGWRACSRFAQGHANLVGPAARTSSPISGLRTGKPSQLPDLLDEFGRAQGGWASPKPAAMAAKNTTATVPVGI